MHLLVRDSRTLDDAEAAVDPGLAPADLVFLSFSDSDLNAAAAAWEWMTPRPSLRLANLGRLRHPMSVDLLVEQTRSARCIVIRLLGGIDTWRYGLDEFLFACRASGAALVVLPGDGRDDAQLALLSTVAAPMRERLDRLLAEGGVQNLARALRVAAYLGGDGADPDEAPVPVPVCGELPWLRRGAPDTVILFYRSQLLAGDIAPLTALAEALEARGLAVALLYVASLKEASCAAFVRARLAAWRPAVVLNATLFSARDATQGSPLDAADAPVLQVLMPGVTEAAWRSSSRGLSAADLAMQVVLPEADGRTLATAISFKSEAAIHPELGYARSVHRPFPEGIALAADRALGWARLAGTPPSGRRVALVLSDYPGGQTGHAVGLDSFASAAAILHLLRGTGYAVTPADSADIAAALCGLPAPFLALAQYRRLLTALPASLVARVVAAWGQPEEDPALREGSFHLAWRRQGALILALQPDRGARADRRAGYHDPDTPPRHLMLAFHLWLRIVEDVHALIHLGTHGTLEWLPGKAVALSAECAPAALVGGLPVIYPFIVNNPGEAAAARRRLGAVTIGHLTPPLREAGLAGEAQRLEALLDEYAVADGLDRRRTPLLRQEILAQAEAAGLLAESGVPRDASPEEALARLDAYLCDVKALAIRDGLHILATPSASRDVLQAALVASCPDAAPEQLAAALDASPAAEAAALLAALDGKFVQPGPAGAPTRGRADVLPTGRNLATIDPRGVPTETAMRLAERAADALLRRHRQEHGEWPRTLVLDLWGSASLRTGGEAFALALILIGARPLRDAGSQRLRGIDILPLALLDRPRVDVTLRISGLFRDAFADQLRLFGDVVRAIAARDEAPDWNPLAGTAEPVRIYGPAAGCYGTGIETFSDREAVAAHYLAASAHIWDGRRDGVPDLDGFAEKVAGAAAFLHPQDHAETDLLDSREYAAHEGGFAAAAASLGATPALYHGDMSRPESPVIRDLAQEVARIVRGRAANPRWIAGMMRYGAGGAAEIVRPLEALHGFAATLPARFDRQFDLLFDATLGDPAVDAFLRAANARARDAMAAGFAAACDADLWRPRRNDVGEWLA